MKLGEGFEKQLGLVLIKIEHLKKQKTYIYICSYSYMIIGSILIISQKDSFTFSLFDYEQHLRISTPFLIISLGFGLLILASKTLKQYRKK